MNEHENESSSIGPPPSVAVTNRTGPVKSYEQNQSWPRMSVTGVQVLGPFLLPSQAH